MTQTLKIRNWTENGDISCVTCTCGGVIEMEPDTKRPIPPFTSGKCQRSTCEKRWRMVSVNASEEGENGG